ncbi:uncharacterized protein [Battus philenor]|uniref:uncharacterized protein n=1 Tax=Battus philenor TaxID=42288 RepID=UPI0035CFC309
MIFSKMPYYCTVPRCTSMAGKAKNVSFHQFPRDEELAKVWNDVLKRGKPYTKYSKVCSLHFKPEDYTITGLGRNKGQWRTLRKDAVPSQNLPSESPGPCQRNINKVSRVINVPSDIMDSQLQQVAQAFYTQTMLAIASGAGDLGMNNIYSDQAISLNMEDSTSGSSNSSGQFNETLSQIERLLHRNNISNEVNTTDSMTKSNEQNVNSVSEAAQNFHLKQTYKCIECSKCFKDPDVFILHKRTHAPKNPNADIEALRKTLSENAFSEKENLDNNITNKTVNDNSTEDTLRANPILANLLKSGMPHMLHKDETQLKNDCRNIASIENQIMAAVSSNMKNYFRNLSSMITQSSLNDDESNENVISDNSVNGLENNYSEECLNNVEMKDVGNQEQIQIEERNLIKPEFDANCDKKDLIETIDSSS